MQRSRGRVHHPAEGSGSEPARPRIAQAYLARWILSFFIREYSVLALRPNRSAAFPRPRTLHAHSARARRMWSRSTRSSVPVSPGGRA